MDNQLTKKEALVFTLQRQNEQGEALVEVLQNVMEIEANVIASEGRVNKKIEEMEALTEKLSEELTINYEQQQEIRSIVNRLATDMAKNHQAKENKVYSNNLFKAWKGRFISRIYAKLKVRMNVVRYTAIRKIDFPEAYNFVSELTYEDFTEFDLAPTPSILNILAIEKEDKP